MNDEDPLFIGVLISEGDTSQMQRPDKILGNAWFYLMKIYYNSNYKLATANFICKADAGQMKYFSDGNGNLLFKIIRYFGCCNSNRQ